MSQIISEALEPDEFPLYILPGQYKQVLVALGTRLVIAKRGWKAGLFMSRNLLSLDYGQIESILGHKKPTYVEVVPAITIHGLTAEAAHSNPWSAMNCVPIYRSQVELVHPALEHLREIVRRTHLLVAGEGGPVVRRRLTIATAKQSREQMIYQWEKDQERMDTQYERYCRSRSQCDELVIDIERMRADDDMPFGSRYRLIHDRALEERDQAQRLMKAAGTVDEATEAARLMEKAHADLERVQEHVYK